MNADIIEKLLEAPDSQLDASMKPLISKWDSPPTSLQLLEVVDKCIFSSLSSGFVLGMLQMFYDEACKREETTHEANVPLAVWRKELE